MATKENSIAWVCTDLDENQYGRQLAPTIFEFKDNEVDEVINLSKYNIDCVESTINTYGYTLFNPDPVKSLQNIVTLYGVQAQWIIAECLFEMREF